MEVRLLRWLQSLPSHNMCIGTVPSVLGMKTLQTIIVGNVQSLTEIKKISGFFSIIVCPGMFIAR
jgi:hypothetical protein